MSKDSSEPTPVQSTPEKSQGFLTFANCASLAALLLSVVALTVAVCSGDRHKGHGHDGPGMHKRFGGPMMDQGPQGFRGGPGGQTGTHEDHHRFSMEGRSNQYDDESQDPHKGGGNPDFPGQPGTQGEGSQ